MRDSAAAWFDRATSHWTDWPLEELLARKGSTRIAVVIPARNEEPTIGGIVSAIRSDLVEAVPLVDEVLVIDSDSRDRTGAIAAAAGATVHPSRAVRPDLGTFPGKGEALWKSAFVTSADILVFIDADLTGWGTHFVSGLLGPLLTDPRTDLVKGFYDRILDDGSQQQATQGGRVTELVARPLLNLFWPELGTVVQPLAGEWAIRRSRFAELAIPTGYGIEFSVLLDVWTQAGSDAVAQVDLGARAHTHQTVHDLGVMAAEILAVAARRLGAAPALAASAELAQFDRNAAPPWITRPVPLDVRPPSAGLVHG